MMKYFCAAVLPGQTIGSVGVTARGFPPRRNCWYGWGVKNFGPAGESGLSEYQL